MILPRLIVTGASGFIGRRFLELARSRYRIFAVARRSQAECGAVRHPNISWHQIDIGDREPLAELFDEVRRSGGAHALLHLAAHYDFTGDENPEYWRTNVEGLRNVLDLARGLELARFVFASSVAACRFPPPGGVVSEESPPDGEHIYAVTKRLGEEMLAEYEDDFPSCIVRFAAAFSDWCEYPPLFVFLDAWLSERWNARILGGRGHSAIPYIHVRDAALFLQAVIDRADDLEPGEVLTCSPDGAVDHLELFRLATAYSFGEPRRPLHVPRPLCGPGMRLRDLVGRLLGSRPFERPWMARYIDHRLEVDARRTRRRLGWTPRRRLHVCHRVPFLIENLKADPLQWYQRNREAMAVGGVRPSLRVYRLLESHHGAISDAFTELVFSPRHEDRLETYRRISREELDWSLRLVLRNLMSSVQTRERGVFMAYCRDLAERRHRQDFRLEEVTAALLELDRLCVETLRRDPEGRGLEGAIHDSVTVTIEFGVDQIEEVYESLDAGRVDLAGPRLDSQRWGPHRDIGRRYWLG